MATHWNAAGTTMLISIPLLCVLSAFCPPLEELMPILGLDRAEAIGGMVGLMGVLCCLIDLSRSSA
jgi:hypothetical protein